MLYCSKELFFENLTIISPFKLSLGNKKLIFFHTDSSFTTKLSSCRNEKDWTKLRTNSDKCYWSQPHTLWETCSLNAQDISAWFIDNLLPFFYKDHWLGENPGDISSIG